MKRLIKIQLLDVLFIGVIFIALGSTQALASDWMKYGIERPLSDSELREVRDALEERERAETQRVIDAAGRLLEQELDDYANGRGDYYDPYEHVNNDAGAAEPAPAPRVSHWQFCAANETTDGCSNIPVPSPMAIFNHATVFEVTYGCHNEKRYMTVRAPRLDAAGFMVTSDTIRLAIGGRELNHEIIRSTDFTVQNGEDDIVFDSFTILLGSEDSDLLKAQERFDLTVGAGDLTTDQVVLNVPGISLAGSRASMQKVDDQCSSPINE